MRPVVSESRVLCPRCGSPRFEEVSKTELRCAECGLGRRTVPATFGSATPEGDEAPGRLQALSDTGFYREAGFDPFGLDDRWNGLRSLGGWGRAGEVTHTLKLTHGDPFEATSPLVRVRTVHPRPQTNQPALERGVLSKNLVRHLVGALWRSTQALDPEVRGAAFPPPPGQPGDVAEPWSRARLTVDDQQVELRFLERGSRWVGLVELPEVLVGLDVTGWPREQTGLRTVTADGFAPYEEGSRFLRERGRPS